MSLNDGIETPGKSKKTSLRIIIFLISVVLIICGAITSLVTYRPKSISTSLNTKVAKKTGKVGQDVIIDDVYYKVNSVTYNPGTKYAIPRAGNQFVIVNVTVTNKGKKTIDYNLFDFKLDDKGNQTALTESIIGDDGKNIVNDRFPSGSLAQGGSVTGTMVGQAKIADKDSYNLLYQSNRLANKNQITFNLN